LGWVGLSIVRHGCNTEEPHNVECSWVGLGLSRQC